MKLNRQVTGIAAIVMVAGLLLVPADSDARRGQGHGNGGGGQQAGFSSVVENLPAQDLSAEEEMGLLKMREEEKLARDVYQVLYKKWNQPVFSNIAQSEQRHMDAVKVLLDKYNMVDPAANLPQGEFTDPELQKLYNSLTAQGQQSLQEALLVGATIEDLDIKDLYDFLEQTDNRDIQIVYQNLLKGSRNHMRAFHSQLLMEGVTYEAQFLTDAQIQDIVSSPRERGAVDENGEPVNRGGKNRQGRGRGQNRS